MEPEEFPCEIVRWDTATRMAADLGHRIRSSSFTPDVIIAIGRGGYVPARVVCDVLVHEVLTSIRVSHWGVAAVEQERAEVTIPLSMDISGQRVLVVDDVTDTGETLEVAGEYLSGLGPEEVRTAVLHHKETSPVVPDYYIGYVSDWRWIIYPWAVREDLGGFICEVLRDGPAGRGEIKSALYRRYALKPEEGLLDEVIGILEGGGYVDREGDRYIPGDEAPAG
ncbi:MAG: phosphoribosyltransferase [Methanoculleaceae archaeon]